MVLTHSFTVPATPQRTWELLTDLEQVGGCFPGARVTSADEEKFEGEVKVKLGPIAVTYQGKGRFLERDDEAHHAKIEGVGRGLRGLGNATAIATMDLAADGDGTAVDIVTDLSITGKPAQFGRGVMQTVSDKLLGQFVQCLETKLTGHV